MLLLFVGQHRAPNALTVLTPTIVLPEYKVNSCIGIRFCRENKPTNCMNDPPQPMTCTFGWGRHTAQQKETKPGKTVSSGLRLPTSSVALQRFLFYFIFGVSHITNKEATC